MPVGPNNVWYPDTNPLQGTLSNVEAIQNLSLFPLRQQALQLSNAGQQISNATSQQTLAQTRADSLGHIFASTQSDAEMPGAMERAVAAGLIPPDQASALVGQGPQAWHMLRNQAVARYGSAPEVGEVFGTPGTVNTGGAIKSTVTKVSPEGVTTDFASGTAANVPLQLSPETQAGYVSIKRDDGSTLNVPRSEIEDAQGRGIPNVPGPDGKPLTGPHGEIIGSLPAGQEGALASTARNQADRANALQTAFEGSAGRKALLQELSQVNGEFHSGPGAKHWSNALAEADRIAASLGLNTHFAEDDHNGASAQMVFGKIAQMIATQQRDTLGLPATNAGEAAAEIAAPNSQYSPEANSALIGQLEGNEDLLQKKQSAWSKYSKAGGSYNGFISQFNRTYDPRFFWDQYVPDAQKAGHSMTPAQRSEYERRKAAAMSLQF